MQKFLLASLSAAVMFGAAQPAAASPADASIPTAPAVAATASNPERPEHVVFPAPAAGHPRLAAPATPDVTLASRAAAARRSTAHVAAAGPVAIAGAFLTRPYTTWHNITSVFDHCNPDYSTDGRVCEFDGSVGLRSNGVDPGFSLGYAQTPGGGDYLYYDGHNGWDYALAYENILAAGDGTVQLAGSDTINPCFGQTVIINHPSGYSTRYAHLSSIYVGAGQSVARGQVIGVSGNTGCSSGPHLHFGVYVTSSWTAIDPWGWWGAAGADPWPSDPGNLWLTGSAQFPLPWAPTSVTATPGDTAALVSWTAPGFDGGTPIRTYTVTASPGGATATVAGTQTSAQVTGLTNATTYSFTVSAVNAVGGGPTSAPSPGVTLMGVPEPPIAVYGVPGIGSAAVSWIAPNPGGSPILGYSVTVSPGNRSINAGLATSVNVSGLSNGSTYQFAVVARNSQGVSAAAASNAVTPLAASAWTSLGGGLSASPAAASTGSAHLDVFVRGMDNQLWRLSYQPTGWVNWQALGGSFQSDPAVAASGNGHLDVFVRGTDDQLWHRSFDGATWGAWEALGGVLRSAPAATSWGQGRIDVVVRGVDDEPWHIAFDGGAWGTWEPLGGVITSKPSVTSWGKGRLDVLARGADTALWHRAFDGGGWGDWESLGGGLASGPASATWGPGRLDVFVRGADSSLWHRWYDGYWSPWAVEGTGITGDPAAVSWGPGRIDVFVRGTNAGLWQKAYD